MMRPLVCLVLLAGLAAGEPDPVNDDTILLKNGHNLVGTILTRLEPGTTTVKISTGHGCLELPQDMIESMKVGLRSRLRMLDPTSYREHIDLALWCLGEDMKREAFDLIKRALTLGEGDALAVGWLALLTDELERSPEKAMPHYLRYRDELGGKDPRILERLAELEAAEAKYQEELAAAMAKADTVKTDEGMETSAWIKESPNFYNTLDKELVEIGAKDSLVKNQVLRLKLKGGDKFKAAVRHRLSIDGRTNRRVVFYVLNDSRISLPVSVAVKTGEKWEYFESRTRNVPAGRQWTRVEFDLGAKDFKCHPEWVYNRALANPEDVREVQLQFHNGPRDIEVCVDGIGFTTDP